ncbi:MAG: hypothetical protein F4213_08525 [Boseongicola sp. SB0677_bin_26]|nr:hypothetical protein [Boseongicola sp. SB0665_bin_10]MYG26056.1 hypothetical protein [Boseongicola sp. SB0677_bin_26]
MGFPDGTVRRKSWTEDEVGTLIELWIEGQSVDDISCRLQRTSMSVQVKASRLNLPPRDATRGRLKARVRPCLVCSTLFFSEGPHHRVCDACKKCEDWQGGAGEVVLGLSWLEGDGKTASKKVQGR